MLYRVCPPELPTRRGVLVGLVAVTAAALTGTACSATPEPAPSSTSVGPADPDASLVLAAIVAERTLIDAYDTAIGRAPLLAPVLTVIRDEHAAHAAALRGLAQVDEPTTVPALNIPGAPAGILAALRTAERDAAEKRTTSCATATGYDCARTLALIAASEAGHDALLSQESPR
jgi:hypothetical protein